MKRHLDRAVAIALLAALLLAVPLTAWGLSTDSEQPINLEADQAELDQAEGISTYTGNVVVTQGSMKVEADRMVVHLIDGEIDRIEATGAPARFRQRPDGKSEDVRGTASKMDYFAERSLVVLSGNAWVEQAGDSIRGARIEYSLTEDRVKAQKGSGESDRVRITLQPRKSDDDD
jgi:lipopolysaccharide export system protein LptA